MRVNMAEAKKKLPKLLKAVESGESVTICRRGIPIADLVATNDGVGRPRFGTLTGRIVVHDPEWWKPLAENELSAFLDGH